MNSIT
jgi:hypothetical protein